MNVIKKRNLSELLSGIKDTPSTKITGICDDSRNIKKGDVFFAFQGDISHGMDYLEIVLEAGAAAIIYELPYANITENNSNIPIIGVDNLNKFKGEIANRWHNNISKKLIPMMMKMFMIRVFKRHVEVLILTLKSIVRI